MSANKTRRIQNASLLTINSPTGATPAARRLALLAAPLVNSHFCPNTYFSDDGSSATTRVPTSTLENMANTEDLATATAGFHVKPPRIRRRLSAPFDRWWSTNGGKVRVISIMQLE